MNTYKAFHIINTVQRILHYITLLLLAFIVLKFLLIAIIQIADSKVESDVPAETSCLSPVASQDFREIKLKAFLETRASRMAENTTYFVQTADKYGLDWTLIPSISGIESNFGNSMPEGSNNPFGIGGRGPARFSSIPEAIEYEGELLAKYRLISTRAIGAIYCPKEDCNEKWAETVTGFSNEILSTDTDQ